MSYVKETIKCPKCGNKIRVKIYHELSNDNIEMIYDMSFLNYKCNKCNEMITLNYDIVYKTNLFHVFYCTDNKEICDKFNISRITKTYDDFKEKVLILSDGFNDLVISFLKCFVHDDKELSKDKNFKDLRYNEASEEGITFYAIGLDKYLFVPMEMYNNILKKSKFKKCNQAIVVDEVSFRKYMKVR